MTRESPSKPKRSALFTWGPDHQLRAHAIERWSPFAWLLAVTFGLLAMIVFAAIGQEIAYPLDSENVRPETSLSREAIRAAIAAAFLVPSAIVGWRVIPTLHPATTRRLFKGFAIGMGLGVILTALTVGVGVVVTLIGERFGYEAPNVAHATLELLAPGPGDTPLAWWAIIINVALFVPLFEEVLFRGILQTAILRWTASPWLAIGGTTVIFTMLHLNNATPASIAMIATLSVGLGIVYERTDRLSIPIAMHAVFNTANILQLVLTQPPAV